MRTTNSKHENGFFILSLRDWVAAETDARPVERCVGGGDGHRGHGAIGVRQGHEKPAIPLEARTTNDLADAVGAIAIQKISVHRPHPFVMRVNGDKVQATSR